MYEIIILHCFNIRFSMLVSCIVVSLFLYHHAEMQPLKHGKFMVKRDKKGRMTLFVLYQQVIILQINLEMKYKQKNRGSQKLIVSRSYTVPWYSLHMFPPSLSTQYKMQCMLGIIRNRSTFCINIIFNIL